MDFLISLNSSSFIKMNSNSLRFRLDLESFSVRRGLKLKKKCTSSFLNCNNNEWMLRELFNSLISTVWISIKQTDLHQNPKYSNFPVGGVKKFQNQYYYQRLQTRLVLDHLIDSLSSCSTWSQKNNEQFRLPVLQSSSKSVEIMHLLHVICLT